LKLGTYAHISISVQSLKTTATFYSNIGFNQLWEHTDPKPWSLMTDGKINIHLYESDFPSPALHYFSARMEDIAREIRREGISLDHQKSKDGARKQHTLYDPSDFAIMLMHHDDADMPKPRGESDSPLGTFGELSIGTESLRNSVSFWQKLDFVQQHASQNPYPWAILSDGIMTIGLHQSDSFAVPALMYFSPEIAERTKELERRNIAFTPMIGVGGELQGATVTAPDGQVFLLLKGDT
jgi:hypothetical protein